MSGLISHAARLAVLLSAAFLAGCDGNEPERSRADQPEEIGDPRAGRRLIAAKGCGSCHVIPGIRAAKGLVGPSLDQVGERIYLAGVLSNTPGNMTAWIKDPQAILPGNPMPDVGLTEAEARDTTAYLYTLK